MIHEATGVVTNPEWVAYAPIIVAALVIFIGTLLVYTWLRRK